MGASRAWAPHRPRTQVAQTPWRNEVKHLPAARTSPFYVGRGYQPKIDWTEGKKSAVTRIVEAKEMVAGQAHELTDTPRAGSMRDASAVLRRRGDVGRKRMKAAE